MDKMTKIVLLVASFFTVLLVILSIVLFRDVSTSPPEVTIGSVLFKSAIFLMIAGVAGWWLSSKKVKHFFISMGYCLFVFAGLSWIWAEPLKQMPNLKKAIDVKMLNTSGIFSWGTLDNSDGAIPITPKRYSIKNLEVVVFSGKEKDVGVFISPHSKIDMETNEDVYMYNDQLFKRGLSGWTSIKRGTASLDDTGDDQTVLLFKGGSETAKVSIKIISPIQ